VVLTSTVLERITSYHLRYPRLRLSRADGPHPAFTSPVDEYCFAGCKGNVTQRPATFRVDVVKPMITACKTLAVLRFRKKRLCFFHKRQYVKSAGVSINLSMQHL